MNYPCGNLLVNIYSKELNELDRNDNPIKVGVVGAGSMGTGVCWQIGRTPGMRLTFVADKLLNNAVNAAKTVGLDIRELPSSHNPEPFDGVWVDDECLKAIELLDVDVLVECSNSISDALQYCLSAIYRKSHVVLMNAEVDLAYGRYMRYEAERMGVIVTSDGGDQHGVLMTMIEEIKLWDFKIVQAGNIKGFLNRYATAESLLEEAAKRRLNPIQCCAYTDGTKLNIEMALVSNGTGLNSPKRGMTGPPCDDVREVLDLFDFKNCLNTGCIDYVLGAQPGGGVYVVGYCDDPSQMPYLSYYKLGNGPYYLFYRPYHLCHLETPITIAKAVLFNSPVLQQLYKTSDVFTFAKRDIMAGEIVHHGIGGDQFYGLVDSSELGDNENLVPITAVEVDKHDAGKITRDIKKDEPITWEDLELPDSYMKDMRLKQAEADNQHMRSQ